MRPEKPTYSGVSDGSHAGRGAVASDPPVHRRENGCLAARLDLAWARNHSQTRIDLRHAVPSQRPGRAARSHRPGQRGRTRSVEEPRMAAPAARPACVRPRGLEVGRWTVASHAVASRSGGKPGRLGLSGPDLRPRPQDPCPPAFGTACTPASARASAHRAEHVSRRCPALPQTASGVGIGSGEYRATGSPRPSTRCRSHGESVNRTGASGRVRKRAAARSQPS